VDGNANKKDRRRKKSGAEKTMDQRAAAAGKTQGMAPDEGMSPTVQAHIGRHIREMFDEVAQEPIPDHLLRLLKDLDRSGDK
jgi:hypothetical protein